MKKILLLLTILPFVAFGQGTMDFEGATGLTGSYADGTFTENGIFYTYGHSRDQDSYAIDGQGLMLRNASESYFEWTIPDGVGELSFEYRKAFTGAAARELELIVNGDPVATTPEFGSGSGEQTDIYTLTHNIDLSGGVTIKIKNVGISGSNKQTVIDNLVWTAGPTATCDAPTNLAVANIGETSAEASWTASGTETEWLVIYGPTGFDFTDYQNNTDVTEITTSDNPYSITGLDAETEYDVYVIAQCDATTFSTEVGPVTFTTTASSPATCDAPTNLAVANIGETSADASWTEGGSETEWLVIYGPTGFDFSDYQNNAAVTEITTTDNPYSILGLDAETDYDVYVIAQCDATTFSTEVGPVTFTTTASSPGTCDAPTNLAVANIGETSAEASWTASGTETEWLVIYGPTGFDFTDYENDADVTEITTSDNPYSITGLDEETEYDVYVIAKCDDALFSDELGPVTFTTAASPATCDAPTNLAVANIGETSAEASWTEGGSETEWLVIYGPTGFDFTDYENNAAVTEITTSDNPYSITGLTAETGYDVYVIAKCDATTFSTEVGPVAFTTAATPLTCDAPSNLAVANIGETSADASWTVGGSETEWLVIYGPTGFDFSDYENNAAVTEITTSDNPYSITGLTAETEYDVYVIAKCDATTYSTEVGPVAFTTAATPLTCDAPSNLAVANIGETSADASWTEGGSETEWLVIYGPTGFDFTDYENNAAVTEITTSDNPYSITGLTAETGYDVYVIAKCDATTFSTEVGPVTFTTAASPATCDAPTNLAVANIGETTADASWTAGGTETEWLVIYGPTGFDFTDYQNNADVTEITTTDNPYSITGLTAETGYDVYVIAQCDATTFSTEVGPVTFTTQTSSLDKHDFAKFSFYPNPTQNELNLKAGLNIENVEVYDMLGKNVITVSPNTISTKVNTEKLQNGVYIMKVTINGVQESYRVIKK